MSTLIPPFASKLLRNVPIAWRQLALAGKSVPAKDAPPAAGRQLADVPAPHVAAKKRPWRLDTCIANAVIGLVCYFFTVYIALTMCAKFIPAGTDPVLKQLAALFAWLVGAAGGSSLEWALVTRWATRQDTPGTSKMERFVYWARIQGITALLRIVVAMCAVALVHTLNSPAGGGARAGPARSRFILHGPGRET